MKHCIAVFLFASSFATAAAALDEHTPISADGFGPIAVGMTLPAASQVASVQLAMDKDNTHNDHCFYANFEGDNAVDSITLMVDHNKVSTFTVYNPNISTKEKIGIGSSMEDIKKAYPGKWHVRKNVFGDAGDDDIVVSVSPTYGYVFFINDKKVHYYSVGSLHALENVEGCS